MSVSPIDTKYVALAVDQVTNAEVRAAATRSELSPVRSAGKVDIELARSAARQLESFVRSQSRNLEFRVDDSTGVVVVRVRDAGTGEVIRQIPSETALRFAQRLAATPGDGIPTLMLDEVI